MNFTQIGGLLIFACLGLFLFERRQRRVLKNQEIIIESQKKTVERLLREIGYVRNDIKRMQRNTDKKLIDLYRQIEYRSLIAELLPGTKLHGMRSWAISPDALYFILNEILEKKPKYILELGSGVTTVAITDLIKKYNLKTKLYSVDHSEEYLQKTKRNINSPKFVEFIHAPLVRLGSVNKGAKWYDTKRIRDAVGKNKIDMLIVDGPPQSINSGARLPAYSELSTLLSANSTIFLDDYGRVDEREAVANWVDLAKSQKRTAHIEDVITEKGLAKIELEAKGSKAS